jgi:HEAT repeat protein
MMDIDFQPYLASIATTYEKWWQLYTLTDAEGRQRQEKAPDFFDFGLMVQTVSKPEQEQLQGGESERQKEKIERFSVLDGLRKHALGDRPEQVLLIGRPGSGKSTALARLMLEEVALTPSPSPNVGRGEPERIPVLVELRYWQGSITQLILNAFNRHDLPVTEAQLETVLARSFVLFDGVNELPSEEARRQLMEFRRNHLKLPMIFTTRDVSLGGDLGTEHKLEMQPLTKAQMQQFIRAYIPGQAEQMLQQLNERLREFGQTPLLLWMLCEVFQQAPDNQLPSNLGGVFQAFTKTYEESSVRKHEVALLKGDVRPLSDRRLWKKALMTIAAIMMQGKTPIDFRAVIHRDEAEKELSRIFPSEQFPVRDILDDLLKYHLLQNRSADQIEFRHQLLQEYYAAEALLRQLPSLTDTQLKQDYLNYLKWTESLVLMLALVDSQVQAVGVVRQALEVDLVLGARLAGAVKSSFQEQTVAMVSTLDMPEWLKIELLGKTKSQKAIPFLKEVYEKESEGVFTDSSSSGIRGAANAQLLRLGYFEHLDRTSLKFSESGTMVEDASEGQINPYRKESLEMLKFLEENNLDAYSNYLESLNLLDNEDALNTISQRLKSSDSYGRMRAINALGMIGTEEIIPVLLQIIEDQNSSDNERVYAAEVLGRLKLKSAIPQLTEIIRNNSNFDVCLGAVFALSIFGSEDAILGLALGLQSPCFWVYSQAIDALERIKSVKVIPILLDAMHHFDISVRQKAAFILKSLSVKEEIREILVQKAVPALLKMLKSSKDEMRWQITFTLWNILPRQQSSVLLDKLSSHDSDSSLSLSSSLLLGKFGYTEAIPGLIQAIEYPKNEVGYLAAYALGQIKGDAAARYLTHLHSLLKPSFPKVGEDAQNAITSIQNRCKYYNYEVYQAYLEAQQRNPSADQTSSHPSTVTYNIGNVGILNSGSVTIQGDQIGEQTL